MRKNQVLVLGLLSGCTFVGCAKDEPGSYGRQRPPVDQLVEDNRGIQSKDVVTASELMANDLLRSPRLRQAADKWTMVSLPIEDRTLDPVFLTNYDTFIERLRVRLAQQSAGNVQLVQNKARMSNMRNKELDQVPVGPGNRLEADFALGGKIMDMPNRRTNYYMVTFEVTAMKTTPVAQAGEVVWTGMYEVQAAR